MKYGSRLVVLILFSYMLFPAVGIGQEATEIRYLGFEDGRSQMKSKDSLAEMQRFVFAANLLPIAGKELPLNDEIFVKAGAHLSVEYDKQRYWVGYDTRVKIWQNEPELLVGEILEMGKGGVKAHKLTVIEARSEYYLQMDAGGKPVLYVIDGEVRVRNEDTGKEEVIKESIAIDEKLIELSEEETKAIAERALMMRDHLGIPITLLQKFRHYWWAGAVGVTIPTAILVWREVTRPSESTHLNVSVESR